MAKTAKERFIDDASACRDCWHKDISWLIGFIDPKTRLADETELDTLAGETPEDLYEIWAQFCLENDISPDAFTGITPVDYN